MLIYQTEKTLTDNKDKLPAEEVAKAEEAIEKAKGIVKDGSVEDIDKALEELQKASHKLAELMYQAASEAQAG